jgi:hypothetical protein
MYRNNIGYYDRGTPIIAFPLYSPHYCALTLVELPYRNDVYEVDYRHLVIVVDL